MRPAAPGAKDGDAMIYTLKPESASVFVAWGPPCTPKTCGNQPG